MNVMDVTVPRSMPCSMGTMSTSSGRMTTSTFSFLAKPLSTHVNVWPENVTLKSLRMMPSTMLLSPIKSATKAFSGSLYISIGVPICWMRPSDMTTMVSDMLSASS